MAEHRILVAAARLNDKAAMRVLLAPIKNSRGLHELLRNARTSFRAQSYEQEARLARYVTFDPVTRDVTCYTVTDLSIQEAANIAVECDAIRMWNQAAFEAAVDRALGGTTRMSVQ